jgi:hypothetical protein
MQAVVSEKGRVTTVLAGQERELTEDNGRLMARKTV